MNTKSLIWNRTKVSFVTGAKWGIGIPIATLLVIKGYEVYKAPPGSRLTAAKPTREQMLDLAGSIGENLAFSARLSALNFLVLHGISRLAPVLFRKFPFLVR